MCLRSIAGDGLGAVNRGRRLPLCVCWAVLTLWCVGAGAEDARVVPYAGSRDSATSLTRTLKRWYSFEMRLLRMPRVLTCPKATRSLRKGEEVEVRRSPQAVACRKRYAVEPGKPQRAPVVGTAW